MPQLTGQLFLSVAALAVTLGFRSLTVNRLVKRKLRLSLVLLVAALGVGLIRLLDPYLSADVAAELRAIQNLARAAALINLSVLVAINPLRQDRVPDRFPAILQDFIVIGLVLVASTFFSDRLLTTSAVSAVVLGFALQDTLGNAFAGLAIQSEKPFHVGHWIRVGEFEGRVEEVTWRATKLRTKAGNFVVLPNNLVSKEAITNYSTAIQIKPNFPGALVNLGAALAAQGRLDEAIQSYRQALQVNSDSEGALNNLAWILATAPDNQLRDGIEAVALAERACELTHYGEPSFIGTLAAAYAEAGRFEDAVATSQKAYDLALSLGRQKQALKNQELLQLFKNHQPYREKAGQSD